MRRWWSSLASRSRCTGSTQLPLEIPPDSELEPDLAVLSEEPDPNEHPHSAMLVVEVAVTSHMVDRNVKARHYARARVPAYWIVDVPARTVEIRTEPVAGRYERCETYSQSATVPSPLEGIEDVSLASLFERVDD